MTPPGSPRWFERVPSWALSAAALLTSAQVRWLLYLTALAALVGITAGALR
jgi:hypothetical protein